MYRSLTTPSGNNNLSNNLRKSSVSSICRNTSLFIGLNVVSGLLFGQYIPVEASKIASYVGLGSMFVSIYSEVSDDSKSKYISNESLQKVCLGTLVAANSVYIPYQLFHNLPEIIVPTLAVSSVVFASSALYGYLKPLKSLSHFSKYSNHIMIPLLGLYAYNVFNPISWQLNGIGNLGLLAFLFLNITKDINSIHIKKYSDLCNVYFFTGLVLIGCKTFVLSVFLWLF